MLERFLDKVEFDSLEDFRKNYKVNVPKNFNFGYDIVDAWAEEQPDKKAIFWTNEHGEERIYTYADMKRYTDKTASFFQQVGVQKGDRVMLILKRRIEFWFAIIALHKIGAIAIPANHMLRKEDLVYRNNSAEIKAIVAVNDTPIINNIEESLSESPSVELLISAGQVENGTHNSSYFWHNMDIEINDVPPFVRPDKVSENNDLMLIYFTSGSSGNPKMVAHNFLYPLGHIVTAKYWQNLNENSLHFTYADTGWGKAAWGKLYGQMIAGACLFIYDHDKFNAANLLSILEKYHIDSFCAPPTIFRFLICEDLSKYDLSGLRYCTIAGEPLNPVVFETWRDATGTKFMEGFGQTETPVLIANFPWIVPKPGSTGVPNPEFDIDLLTPDGRSAEDGEAGEIIIHTAERMPLGLFQTYFRHPEQTEKVHYNGIYHTGDVAWRDADGYYWFVGRTDDVIKSSGYRISPFEVESVLITHPAVVECAVTGVPDEIRGQIIKATVVLTEEYRNANRETLTKELQKYVKTMSAPYKYPRVIDYVDELPKTFSGKIRRKEIRERDEQK